MQSEIFVTEDGSHTLYVPAIDECYHSTHGAIQESLHIFIDSCFKKCSKNEIRILEVGFGTGLNAFLTLLEANSCKQLVHYTTIEKFPVELEKVKLLNYPEVLDSDFVDQFQLMHSCNWGEEVEISSNFWIKKIKEDFTTLVLDDKFDIIYFDAFSPEKQPEMWTSDIFQNIFMHSNDAAVLATYCAKGAVRRAMQAAGFRVERIPGPPGKREILRAVRI